MNDCNACTIEELSKALENVFYAGDPNKPRTIYCKKDNLTHPDGHKVKEPYGWKFSYVD
jgi:hypothetical protein